MKCQSTIQLQLCRAMFEGVEVVEGVLCWVPFKLHVNAACGVAEAPAKEEHAANPDQ